jgi:hypothetical protein
MSGNKSYPKNASVFGHVPLGTVQITYDNQENALLAHSNMNGRSLDTRPIITRLDEYRFNVLHLYCGSKIATVDEIVQLFSKYGIINDISPHSDLRSNGRGLPLLCKASLSSFKSAWLVSYKKDSCARSVYNLINNNPYGIVGSIHLEAQLRHDNVLKIYGFGIEIPLAMVHRFFFPYGALNYIEQTIDNTKVDLKVGSNIESNIDLKSKMCAYRSNNHTGVVVLE